MGCAGCSFKGMSTAVEDAFVGVRFGEETNLTLCRTGGTIFAKDDRVVVEMDEGPAYGRVEASPMPVLAQDDQPAAEAPPAEDPAAQPAQEEEVEISTPGAEIVVTGQRDRNVARSSDQVVSVLSSADIARTGEGNIANAPLPPDADGAPFRAAWTDALLPAVDAFRPQLLFISAGFDAHRRDPLAQLRLEAGDYAWITRELVQLANRHCAGRIVSTLEGGYDLEALRESSIAHVGELLA